MFFIFDFVTCTEVTYPFIARNVFVSNCFNSKLMTTYSNNASCLPPPPPPKFCITIVFDFSWDDCNTQEELETMVMQNFEG